MLFNCCVDELMGCLRMINGVLLSIVSNLSNGLEGAKELVEFIFPINTILNGEPRSSLEFPNHLIVLQLYNRHII